MRFSEYMMEMTLDAFARVRMIFRSNFARRGIELTLPAHAFERAVDGERGKAVTEEYLIQALELFLRRFDQKARILERIKQQARDERGRGIQITLRHSVDDTFINIPSVLSWRGGDRYNLTLKTIMVKRDFKPYVNDIIVDL